MNAPAPNRTVVQRRGNPPPLHAPHGTRPVAPPRRMPPELVDRIALFAYACLKEQAAAVTGGLGQGSDAQAKALLEQLHGLDTTARRARFARSFGERWDAPERVRALVAEAAGLEDEIASRLPGYLKSALKALRIDKASAPAVRARAAWIDRLVKEATL